MTQNESEMDRAIRVVLGTILILVSYSTMDGVWQIALYVLGGLLIVTGFTGFCLIYKLLGIATQK
jgi:hypothetical protein